ncbi:MAG: hypothetical protein IT290_04640 [Deltaproteobacteria bacterium]|nr:hypothetical protein [Deltaproteobacteria bacterium]
MDPVEGEPLENAYQSYFVPEVERKVAVGEKFSHTVVNTDKQPKSIVPMRFISKLDLATKLSCLVVAASLVVAIGATTASALDTSDYRQNTYGAPNHYCDPTRALNNSGAGTLVSPWNMSQCSALPVAGDVVGILPGVSVDLPTTNSVRIPAFNPAHSGTPISRIVFVTKYPAVNLASVETNPNRTEFRHDGGAPGIVGGVGVGNGCPMLGSYGQNYVTFDGFFVDMAEAFLREDSGVLRVENTIGVHFRNFVVKGARLTIASNPVIYRPNNSRDTVLSNFKAYDFVNDPTGSATPQGALFSDQYGDQNVLIEHFEIRNISRGIFFKGTANSATVFNYGTVQYGIVSNSSACLQFNDLDFTQVTTVAYNLCYDINEVAAIFISSETSPARNLLVHHNTVARINSASINTSGGIYSRANGFAGNVTIRDNLVDINNGVFGHGADFGEISTLPAVMNYNGYTKNGANVTWSFNGVQSNSLSAWRTATNRDLNSQVLSGTIFVDRTNGNFRIAAGHVAKTASSSGGELGAYAGPRLPGVDVSVDAAPAAPTNFRAGL